MITYELNGLWYQQINRGVLIQRLLNLIQILTFWHPLSIEFDALAN